MCRLKGSGVEHDHRAGEFAALQFVEGFVHLLKLDAARDHLVELQLAGHVEIHEAGHIHREAVRTHNRALNALFAEEVRAVKFDVHADGDHADHVCCAAAPEHAESLFGRDLEADCFEGMMYAAAIGEFHHLRHRVARLCIHNIRCAELLGEVELGALHVDGDDAACARDGGTIDGGKADTAAANHGHGLAGADV